MKIKVQFPIQNSLIILCLVREWITFVRMIMLLVLITELLDDFGISNFPKTPFFTQIIKDLLHANPVSARVSTSAFHVKSSMAVDTFLQLYLIRVYLTLSEDR